MVDIKTVIYNTAKGLIIVALQTINKLINKVIQLEKVMLYNDIRTHKIPVDII